MFRPSTILPRSWLGWPLFIFMLLPVFDRKSPISWNMWIEIWWAALYSPAQRPLFSYYHKSHHDPWRVKLGMFDAKCMVHIYWDRLQSPIAMDDFVREGDPWFALWKGDRRAWEIDPWAKCSSHWMVTRRKKILAMDHPSPPPPSKPLSCICQLSTLWEKWAAQWHLPCVVAKHACTLVMYLLQ